MPTVRTGKTLRDRASGASARNGVNKALRAEWRNDKDATNLNFPRHTCNGKRNRSIIVNNKRNKRVKH